MKYLCLILASFLPALTFAQEITRITVVHQKTYNVVTTLSDTAALATFERHWNAKIPSSLTPEPHWVYKIDIETAHNSDRWLYDPRGWTKLRSNIETPLYTLPAPDKFNTILGIGHAPEAKGLNRD